MSLQSGTRLGPYEIVAPLGAGGMGEVYRAKDTKLNRDVAIKVLPESFALDADRVARFTREAQVLASLNHPNIAQIYGIEESNVQGPGSSVRALVMELVEGQDLSTLIATHTGSSFPGQSGADGSSANPGSGGAQAPLYEPSPMPLADALPIAKQIADALEAAHEQGIVHRDLKPQNIKVRADGTVKVLDFGLAKAIDPSSSSTNLANSPTMTTPAMTGMGMILGTAAYMSPEQAKGRPVDKRADIWAFGAVLYEMLRGKRAFEGEDVSDLLVAVLSKDVDWAGLPTGLPPSVVSLIRRCLNRDPKRRLRDIGEARIILEEVLSGTGWANEVIPRPLRSTRAGVWKVAALISAVSALALGVVSFRHFREQPLVSRPVRFQVPAVDGIDLVGPVVSPDGRFVALRSTRHQQIWLHSLESSTSRAVPGTEGLSGQVFWSPDSRHLAFRVDTRLMRVAIDGSEVQTIATIDDSVAGLSWGDGAIVFAHERGVMQVPEAGGTPTVLIPRDPANAGLRMSWPEFLPGGRDFIFHRGSSPADGEFYLGSLDPAQAPKRLMDAQGSTNVSGYVQSPDPGILYLVLPRTGALIAQAFDTRTREVFGEARRISVDLDPDRAPWVSVSATGVLAYQVAPSADQSQLAWLDRTGAIVATESATGDIVRPYLSRNGRFVAVERSLLRRIDVWVFDLARGAFTRVTTDPADDTRPVLSPDGSRVVFSRAGSIFIKSASGAGSEERLGDGEPTDWSADGKFVLAVRSGDVWALPLEGDRAPVLVAGGKFLERAGRFSPDGKWVAYQSDLSGRSEIYLQSFPPTPADRQIISVDGGDGAAWRGDGRELFFRADDFRLMSVEMSPGPRLRPGVPRTVFQFPQNIRQGRYVPTSDGQRFLVTQTSRERPHTMILLNWLGASLSGGKP